MPEIRVVQLGIMSALREQALVIPLLDNGARLHDHDPVRCLHRGQAVCDQDAGGGSVVETNRTRD